MRKQHSPLPWRVFPGYASAVFSDDGKFLIVEPGSLDSCDNNEDPAPRALLAGNAELIVRACNSHYRMLEALNVVRRSAGWDHLADETKMMIDAAINAAEASNA